eukprot:6057674-Prymnesium_polylepis.1
MATPWVSDACHIDGLVDAPGKSCRRSPRREESMVPAQRPARCDRREAEGECTGGPHPPAVDRNRAFQPLS